MEWQEMIGSRQDRQARHGGVAHQSLWWPGCHHTVVFQKHDLHRHSTCVKSDLLEQALFSNLFDGVTAP